MDMDYHKLNPYFINWSGSRGVSQVPLGGWEMRLTVFLVGAGFGIYITGPVD